MLRILFVVTASAFVLAATSAHAQDTMHDVAETQVIVVTGQGLEETPSATAYGTQMLNEDRLATTASGRIEDALSSVAGFQQFRRSDSRASNPSAQGVTLRALGGNATSRTLVLLDGVPMADPFFGYIPLSAIAPERLASVRITRGAGSGAFASGAVAGTIDLTSAGADALGLFNGSALFDDRGETELSATLAPKLGSGFAIVSGRWDRGQGFWTTPVSQRVSASVRARYESWSFGLRAVAPIGPDIELQARGGAYGDNRTLRFKDADTGMSGQDASLRLVGRGPWQFDVLGYLQVRNFFNTVISATTFLPTVRQRATPSTGAGGKLEVRPPVGHGHILRLGADWRVAEGHTLEDTYKSGVVSGYVRAGGLTDNLGLFVEDDWTQGPVVLTAGARADHWSVRSGLSTVTTLAGVITTNPVGGDRAGWAGSFRGGAVVHVLPSLDLRAAVYSNLRQPTLNELYRNFTVFPITTKANPTLENERLAGFEGGLDWRPLPGALVALTVFDNEVRNAIANVTIDTTTRQRRNVDAVRSRGIEFAASMKFDTFTIEGSISYADARVHAPDQPLDDMRPSQTPRWAASMSAAWQPKPGWTFSTTLRHVGLQYEDDLQSAALPAVTTFDAFAQVPLLRRVSLVLRGENLGNATIITRNSSGSVDTGTPRTIWAGVRMQLP